MTLVRSWSTLTGCAPASEIPKWRSGPGPKRAAIIEHDGGIHPEWAEALARLCHTSPPPQISTERWRLFIDDCAHFVDDGWANHAAALGWKPRDVFGCDAEFADVRPDGLMWITGGAKLIPALASDLSIPPPHSEAPGYEGEAP